MKRDRRQEILTKIRQFGLVRPRDMEAIGISGEYLHKLHLAGVLDRPGRGIYTLVDAEPTENRPLAQAAKRVPHGVICLLTALRFHDLTTESPFEVWMAIAEKARVPRIEYPPLRIVRFSQSSLQYGVKQFDIEGVAAKISTPAKTVADCFKYRNKIGVDVALEALRDCWKQRKATMDDFWEAAKVCRMTKVMRPYMEALV